MLDPLTALGLASNIIQLVDFTSKILSKTKDLRFHGETVDNARLEALTIGLVCLSENLQASPSFNEAPSGKPSQDVKAIIEIANGSVTTALELIECLQRIKFKLNEEKTVWASIRKAIISVSSKERVKEIATLLDSYRNELALRTLVLLSSNVGKHASNHEKRLERLERKEDDIIEAISISQKLNAHQADEQSRLHQRTGQQLREVTAAILTHRDGRTTTLSQPGAQRAVIEDSLSDEKFSAEVMTLRATSSEHESRIDGTAFLGDFDTIQRRVLGSLSFTKIRDRMDEVRSPFYSTFEWVFEPPGKSKLPWDSLLQWLHKDGGCYWINGKAGSGKSTLMKHIFNCPKTQDALTQWAGESRLLVASYFSWNLGTALQKTHVGLLRSLLHDIFSQIPDLVPTTLPKLFRKASIGEEIEPRLADLVEGITNLSRQNLPLKICLFIDGIDEFDGDHAEISSLFTSISNPNFKCIISSRPIPACVDIFAEYPGLRLQDLTYNDILKYTQEKVHTQRTWRELLEEEGPQSAQLITDIVEKAQGVFLWVVLVVASLLEGLRNYDRITDWRRRLDMLPPDPENLYKHMLNRLEPLYFRQASQLLQIVLKHIKVELDRQLTALHLSFADEEDSDYAFRRDLVPLEAQQRLARCRATEGRIRSRCCGLVEVWQDWRLEQQERLLDCRIMFLHRTVVEFLRSDSAASIFQHGASDAVFDPSISLAKCFLIDIKTQSYSSSLNIIQSPVWESMRRCPNHCHFIDGDFGQQVSRIMDELDNTMDLRWRSIDRWISGFKGRDDVLKVVQKFNWTLSELRQSSRLGNSAVFSDLQASLLVLAATMGHTRYVQYKCRVEKSDMEPAQLQQAMIAAVYSASSAVKNGLSVHYQTLFDVPSEDKRATLPDYHSILLYLIDAGGDPNEKVGTSRSNPWSFALGETQMMEENDDMSSWCSILELLLQSGADANDIAIEKARNLDRYSTALSVITTKISQLARHSKWPEARSFENLRSQLLARGAKDRTWTEVNKDSRPERASTPAPWRRDSTNPIEKLFRQADIGPHPREPLTLAEARQSRASAVASGLNAIGNTVKKSWLIGNRQAVLAPPKREKKYPPVSMAFQSVAPAPQPTRGRARDDFGGVGKPTQINTNLSPIRRAPARQSSSESNESGSEPRRGRRRSHADSDSDESSSDSEVPDVAMFQSDPTEDHEVENNVASEEPVAEVPQPSKLDFVKPTMENKAPRRWKFGVAKGVRISALFKR
ncbi:uncharacterized protein PAC_01104 [Phialocephala subalpina]|uniref:Uncharacterized protein n=1 Tax=Phialocephala subalpina TaxID=576137 RepID=A0A1L7WET3_9HELO|nr:uncharacterized protein PAC_01104 [Phialocephala subalpina]